MRCGISFGPLAGGVIDGKTFRVFGPSINLAQRLESVCEKNYINISNVFYESLPIEDQKKCEQQTKELKGFGEVTFYRFKIKNRLSLQRRKSFVDASEFSFPDCV